MYILITITPNYKYIIGKYTQSLKMPKHILICLMSTQLNGKEGLQGKVHLAYIKKM